MCSEKDEGFSWNLTVGPYHCQQKQLSVPRLHAMVATNTAHSLRVSAFVHHLVQNLLLRTSFYERIKPGKHKLLRALPPKTVKKA